MIFVDVFNMKSYGKFKIDVKADEDDDVVSRANDIILMLREEISDPELFMQNLEPICIGIAKFMECRVQIDEEDGYFIARFDFRTIKHL